MLKATLRREQIARDKPFLFELFCHSRGQQFAHLPLPPEQKESLFQQQFQAQDQSFTQNYTNPNARRMIVEIDGKSIGRLITHEQQDDLRIIDIALMPPWRDQGLGEKLLRDVLAEAKSAGKQVSLSVEAHNPAKRLYERLGFRLVEERPPYCLMVIPVSAHSQKSIP